MKRALHLVLVLLLLGGAAQSAAAQNGFRFGGEVMQQALISPEQMARLSQDQHLGTARSMAMGSAFTSLGGDMSTLFINPAGLGMYRTNEFSLTPLVTLSRSENGAKEYRSNNSSRFAMANIGFALNLYEGTGQLISLNMGFAYNRKKNVDLVTECFLSMFRLIERHGWGCPAQVEVENHLMSQWRDSFLKAGNLFPYVRFCAPMNSQEKYAEPLNGAKKRSIEHKNHLGIGRFYAKSRAYRTESKKVFDELNDTYEDKQYYSWEELIADDARDVMEFNNSLHPNQKKYPGMTRWQVLENNMNPTLKPMNKAEWARFIGEHVETSIRRNSYCRVGYKDWWLSDTKVIERLAPNNRKVDAYLLTNDEGEVTDVYIYQNGKLIDRLEDVGTFNTADVEQTDEDREIFVEQRKKIARFNSYVKEHKVEAVGGERKRYGTELLDEAAGYELPALEEDDTMSMVTYHVPGALESL